jgi:hemerythrin-like metal-binding protein
MEFTGWDESYSVGHPRMDEHHRKVFEILADLKMAMASSDVLLEYNAEWQIAERLVNHASIHLAEEEAIMAAVGYPDLERHKESHRFFMSKVGELEYGMGVGSETPALEKLCSFLENWLANHILGADQQYASYVKEAGIQVLSLSMSDGGSSKTSEKPTNIGMTAVRRPHGKHLSAPAVCTSGERAIHYDYDPVTGVLANEISLDNCVLPNGTTVTGGSSADGRLEPISDSIYQISVTDQIDTMVTDKNGLSHNRKCTITKTGILDTKTQKFSGTIRWYNCQLTGDFTETRSFIEHLLKHATISEENEGADTPPPSSPSAANYVPLEM